jgi:hypothetical protein
MVDISKAVDDNFETPKGVEERGAPVKAWAVPRRKKTKKMA